MANRTKSNTFNLCKINPCFVWSLHFPHNRDIEKELEQLANLGKLHWNHVQILERFVYWAGQKQIKST